MYILLVFGLPKAITKLCKIWVIPCSIKVFFVFSLSVEQRRVAATSENSFQKSFRAPNTQHTHTHRTPYFPFWINSRRVSISFSVWHALVTCSTCEKSKILQSHSTHTHKLFALSRCCYHTELWNLILFSALFFFCCCCAVTWRRSASLTRR